MFVWVFKIAGLIICIVAILAIYRKSRQKVKATSTSLMITQWENNCQAVGAKESVFVGILVHGKFDRVRTKSIASTIEEVFLHATCPYRVWIGVALCSDVAFNKHFLFLHTSREDFPLVHKFIGRIKLTVVHESRHNDFGVYRKQLIEKTRRQQYVLFVHTGTKFSYGWDASLISMFSIESRKSKGGTKLVLTRGLLVIRGSTSISGLPIYGFVDKRNMHLTLPDQAIGATTFFIFGVLSEIGSLGAHDIEGTCGLCGSVDMFVMSMCLFLRGFSILGCIVPDGNVIISFPEQSAFYENTNPNDERIAVMVVCALAMVLQNERRLCFDSVIGRAVIGRKMEQVLKDQKRKTDLKSLRAIREKLKKPKFRSAVLYEFLRKPTIEGTLDVFYSGIQYVVDGSLVGISTVERFMSIHANWKTSAIDCYPLGLLGLSSEPSHAFIQTYMPNGEWDSFMIKFKQFSPEYNYHDIDNK